MSGALVVGAAPSGDPGGVYRALLAQAESVVAADAAGEWCVAHGRLPDLVVGDFDSASPGAVERLRSLGIEVEPHPTDKDMSDLDLAAASAHERFGGPLTLTAAFTGRLDHTLASIGTLLRSGAGACAVEPAWSAWAVHAGDPVSVPVRPGQPFGVLSPAGATGVAVRGGRWGLEDAALEALSSSAISNEASDTVLTVSCVSGDIVLIVTAE